MHSKRILLPQPIEKEAIDFLKGSGCEILFSPDPKPETVQSLMKGVHGIILRTGIKMTRALMSHGDELRVVSRTGAGLDVFAKEPLEKDHPLKQFSNVILTPHTAALTQECAIRLALEAARSLVDVFQGKKPEGMVNPEVLNHPHSRNLKKIL